MEPTRLKSLTDGFMIEHGFADIVVRKSRIPSCSPAERTERFKLRPFTEKFSAQARRRLQAINASCSRGWLCSHGVIQRIWIFLHLLNQLESPRHFRLLRATNDPLRRPNEPVLPLEVATLRVQFAPNTRRVADSSAEIALRSRHTTLFDP